MINNITLTTTNPKNHLDLYHLIRLFFPLENVIVEHIQLEENLVVLDKFRIQNEKKVTSFEEKIQLKNDLEEEQKTKLLKRASKRALYQALMKHTNKNLPWGCLTGIRPTQVARDLIKEGYDISLVKEGLQKEFFVSEKKAELVYQTLKNQKSIIRNNNLINLYINIPVCPSRCSYCSFISSEISACAHIIPEYLTAILKEIKAAKELINKKALVVRTIYVGGGTPTVLSAEQLDLLLSELSYPVTEFTVECGRADTITEEKLLILKKHKVNRICINPQTFTQKTLKAIGRTHTNQQVFDAYMLALKHNFVVNMDFIAGLEGETLRNFKSTINTVLELSPHNLTIHTLSLKKGAENVITASEIMQDNEVEKMIDYAAEKLKIAGYKPYYLYRQKNQISAQENVGYMLENKVCLFNIDTMEETLSVIACGASAISKRIFGRSSKINREQNPKFLKDYMGNIEQVIAKKVELFA